MLFVKERILKKMGLVVIIVALIVLGALWGLLYKLFFPLLLLGFAYLVLEGFKRRHDKKFRGIEYKTHLTRESFHDAFYSKECDGQEVHTCELDEGGRIIGAFVTFRGTTLTENKRKIRDGEVKRNDEARKSAFVPGMDSVKSELTEVDGKPYFHYHRTHLIPFRFCLNDGEYSNIMFTGTSRLNAGYVPKFGIIPTHATHSENVEYIIECIRTSPFYYDDLETGSDWTYRLGLSLDDFERVADTLVYDSRESYQHMFKYGVECIYKNSGLIPSHVKVRFTNITTKKVLFSATLRNAL